VDGDTVTIPACAGGESWTSRLSITKGITLQGAGIDSTVLLDDVPKGDSNCASSNPMLSFAVNTPNTFRLTALTIRGSAADTFVCQPGHVNISGTAGSAGTKPFRIDHVKFDNQKTVAIRTSLWLLGVIDHNNFGTGTTSHKQGIVVFHQGWGGNSSGDGSWFAASSFGTADALYIEDNTFSDPSPSGACDLDAFGGARVVYRNNSGRCLVSHGTESSGRTRGVRQFEVYGNTFTPPLSLSDCMFYRGGTGLFYNNNCQQNGANVYTNLLRQTNDRDSDSFSPWGVCAGTGTYDSNDGVVYVSGTHTGGTVSNVLTDSTKDFTTACSGGSCGAGQGFSIRNVTKGWGSGIASVTPTTATNLTSVFGQGRVWDNADSYEIRKAYPCIDQVGRGSGDLLSGSPPVPAAWPNQVLEPVYQWNNTKSGVANAAASTSGTVHILVNRDFYNGTASFDGTSGVGYGLLAARPATCTPFVLYYATDTTKGYRCPVTNTWVEYYSGPLAYPYCVDGVGSGCGGGGSPIATLSQSSLSPTWTAGVAYGASVTLTNTLTNTGGAVLTIASIVLSGNTGDFSMTNDCGATLGVGASCTISIPFRPLRTGAVPQGLITVTTDGGNPTCTLDGTGLKISATMRNGKLRNGKIR
jgi:hypothetical protein